MTSISTKATMLLFEVISLTILAIIANSKAETIIEDLYGLSGGNKVTLCVKSTEVRQCEGALWMQSWVVARANCLEGTGGAPIVAWRGDINCSEEEGQSSSRNVVSRHTAPRSLAGLQLLRLDWPCPTADPLNNRTANSDTLQKLISWVNEINHHISETPLSAKSKQYYHSHYQQMYSSPLKMFLVTVVLPSTAFIVFFLFIIFFTGSNKGNIPYRSLDNEKSAHV